MTKHTARVPHVKATALENHTGELRRLLQAAQTFAPAIIAAGLLRDDAPYFAEAVSANDGLFDDISRRVDAAVRRQPTTGEEIRDLVWTAFTAGDRAGYALGLAVGLKLDPETFGGPAGTASAIQRGRR